MSANQSLRIGVELHGVAGDVDQRARLREAERGAGGGERGEVRELRRGAGFRGKPERVRAPARREFLQRLLHRDERLAREKQDAEQLAVAGGIPRPVEVNAQRALAHARRRARRPGEHRDDIEHFWQIGPRGIQHVDRGRIRAGERDGRGVRGDGGGEVFAEARGRDRRVRDRVVLGVVEGLAHRFLRGSLGQRKRRRAFRHEHFAEVRGVRFGAWRGLRGIVDGIGPRREDIDLARAGGVRLDGAGNDRGGFAELLHRRQHRQLRRRDGLEHRVDQRQLAPWEVRPASAILRVRFERRRDWRARAASSKPRRPVARGPRD